MSFLPDGRSSRLTGQPSMNFTKTGKLEHAVPNVIAYMCLLDSILDPNLNFKTEFNFIYMLSNELLAKKVEHPKVKKIVEVVKREKIEDNKMKIIIFTQFRETATIISRNLNEITGIKSKVFVGQAKKIEDGINTGLSQKEQKKIIDEFSSGKINVLCATCIAEEGLDIPEVNTVIFYEAVPSAIRAIQRTGRTARLMKGKLIMLITKKTRDEAYYYIAKAKEKKMHSAINDIKEELSGNKFSFQKTLK